MGYKVAVVGIGAMGGSMARCLLDSDICESVQAYDRSETLVAEFVKDATAAGKPIRPASSLSEAVDASTQFVILSLLNEPQCDQVCQQLLRLLVAGSTVLVTSTVTAAWMIQTHQAFQQKGIHYIDLPVSGGPKRAREGTLTLMCGADTDALQVAQPLLDCLGTCHVMEGGVGMGSTVKTVHQLLAGVHICAAAEALSLAAAAGLNVQQVYEIVVGAAGNSWMFADRGLRMMQDETVAEVKSRLQIFVKDLDIVYSEAKRLQAPIPLAATALQQFIAGQSLGLSDADDSQVIQVYESITGKPARALASSSSKNNKDKENKVGVNVGDYWKMENGTLEEILEVGQEPRHQLVLSNAYVRALRVSFPPNDTTLAHRHAEDSLYFFLTKLDNNQKLDVVNFVQGAAPACDCMEFGEVRFGTHKSETPLVHKITNKSNATMLCIDAEVLKQPPVVSVVPLMADHHELIKTRDKCRVYKLTLQPGESVTASYPFFFLSVIVEPSAIQRTAGVSWKESYQRGDVAWNEPTANVTKINVGETEFVEYIAEWR